MEDYVDFEEIFKKLIEKHKDDKNYYLIKDYPQIFSLISEIAADKNSSGIIKVFMNCAISYFILPEDIISEKDHGVKGYLDDFFICLHVLSELLKYDKKLGEFLISKHWKLEENYKNYISEKYYSIIKIIEPNLRSEILAYSGVSFIEELMVSKKTPRKYSEIKIRDLQRKIYYLFNLFLNRPIVGKEVKREFESKFFGTDEFMEFSKKLELLNRAGSGFEMVKKNIDNMFNFEETMRDVKVKRLLK